MLLFRSVSFSLLFLKQKFLARLFQYMLDMRKVLRHEVIKSSFDLEEN